MWVGPLAAQFRILCSPAWFLYMSTDTYDHTCAYVIIGTDERISQLPQRTRLCTLHWRQVCQVQQSLEVNKKPMRKIVGAMLSARVWTPSWDGLLGHPTRNCQNGVIFKEGLTFLGHGLKVQTARFGFQVLYFCLKEIGLDSAWTLLFPEIYTNWNCPYKLLAKSDGPEGKQFRDATLDQWAVGIWPLSVGKIVATTRFGMS